MRIKNWKLKVAPEYDVNANDCGNFFKCDDCGVLINHYTDLCNKCYNKS